MIRVNIITKHSAYNFGAMLQTYALEKTVEGIADECRIIDLRQPKPVTRYPWKTPGGIIRNLAFFAHKKNILEGHSRFERFIEDYSKTKKYSNDWELRKDTPEADIYITGSDQVWNPMKISDAFYLRFAPDNAIRASYAASIGVSRMPEGAKSIVGEYLEDMDYISIRERSAKQIIGELTDKNIEVNIDPVFLLSKNEWEQTSIKTNIDKPYILCYVLYRPGWLNEWLRKIHKETGKDIVVVTTDAYRNIYHNKMIRNAGPREFLGLIQGADFVISSSFHGVALSVANRKPFYAVVNPDMPSRINDLLETVHLTGRIITDTANTKLKDIDYTESEAILERERERSLEYLKKIITDPCKAEKSVAPNKKLTGNISCVGDKCTACGVCEKVCPADAVTLQYDKDGYLYPKVDEDKCISCGLCLRKCHTIEHTRNSKENCEAYYGWHRDAGIREASTSGGAFTALAENILSKNGLIVAAYFDAEKKKVVHSTSDEVGMERFRKSKYTESETGSSLYRIEEALKADRDVLFCGTPCQCAGVRRAFGHNDKLLVVDFFCHGVPSAKVFKDYLEYLEKKNGSGIADYQSRTKDFGWSQYGVKIKYNNEKQYDTVSRCEWYYVATMLDDKFLRKACYTCDKPLYHEADITIGDFWGVFKYDPSLNDDKGISVLLANTDKGKEALDAVKSDMELYPVDKSYIDYAFKVKTGDKKLEARNKSFDEYRSVGIEKYINANYKYRMLKYKAMFALKKASFRRSK